MLLLTQEMGLQAVSTTWAKKEILGMSDEEIKLDLQQQRFEKALSAELEKTSEIIQKTGIFTNIDKLYGIPKKEGEGDEGTEGMDTGEDDAGGMGMGMDMETGGGEEAPEEAPAEEAPEPAAEGYNVEKGFPLLMERKGMDLQGLKDAVNKSNRNIDKINTEVDTLLKD